MQNYETIFHARGHQYHEAMQSCPKAREQEFKAALEYLSLRDGAIILDLPAGGGYLESYLGKNVEYLAYDFAGEFEDNHSRVNKCREAKIDLPDQSVDEIVSLAALHHIVERSAFYAEAARILKPGGKIVIGDVLSGSGEDAFLNGFVDKWNSMGHEGVFMNPSADISQIEAQGLKVKFEKKRYFWCFSGEEEALGFFRRLFYLDKQPSDDLLAQELRQLGVHSMEGEYKVSWCLGFYVAEKL